MTLVASIKSVNTAVAKDEKPDLTIAMKEGRDQNFRLLVHKYMVKTGKKVELIIYPKDESQNTRVYTELLSGRGPDLIQGTDFAYWTLAECGALVDIAELMENDPDININDFFQNIVDPFKDEEGHLYIMPCSFLFLFVIVNHELFEKVGMSIPEEWTYESFLQTCIKYTELSEKPLNTAALNGNGDIYILRETERELVSAIDFRNKTSYLNELDNTVFECLAGLSNISKISDSYYNISPYLFFSVYMQLDNYKYFKYIIENNDCEVRNLPRSKYREGEYLFEPIYSMSINKAGNVDEAWQFLKYLLSEEVQTGTIDSYSPGDNLIWNPVNKKAAEKRIELIRKQAYEHAEYAKKGRGSFLYDTKHSPDKFMKQVDRCIELYISLRDALTTPIISDDTLKESLVFAIKQETGKNFNVTKLRNELSRIVDVYMSEEGGDLQSGYTNIYIIFSVTIGISVFTVLFSTLKRKKVKHAPSGVEKGE